MITVTDCLEYGNLEELLSKIEESERRQEKYAKRQYLMTIVMALCCAGMFCAVFLAYKSIVPTAQKSLQTIGAVAEDLGQVSNQLTEADLAALVDHVDKLAINSEEGIQKALEQINSIDIESLNQAIQDLSDVVSPLARLMGRFN